ncbi:MAG: diguanylate cyclase [Desulfobacteraceae bacterium]|jgi:diguanylate cyclase (GGDEF)-like protein
MAQALGILVVDHKETIRTDIARVLEDNGYEVATAANGVDALRLFQQERFPIVITDIYMPKMTGIDLLAAIKKIDEKTQVIVMTGYASVDSAIATIRSGAYDYLIKPFENIALVSNVVRRAAEKIELEQNSGRLIAMLKKKTEQLEKSNAHLQSLATRDNLTGLYNHRYFQESLKAELNRAQRYQRQFSLLFIDLDYFKTFNDTQGHLQGDRLLIDLSNLFLTTFRKSDIVCRYGGDEFAVILPEASGKKACAIATKLHARVADHPFYGREALPQRRVTISIGLATYPDHGPDAEGLLHHADRVMYEAKKNRGQFKLPAEISATDGSD